LAERPSTGVVLQVLYLATHPVADALGAGVVLAAFTGLVTVAVLTHEGQGTVKVVAFITVIVWLLIVTVVGSGQYVT